MSLRNYFHSPQMSELQAQQQSSQQSSSSSSLPSSGSSSTAPDRSSLSTTPAASSTSSSSSTGEMQSTEKQDQDSVKVIKPFSYRHLPWEKLTIEQQYNRCFCIC